MCAHTHIHTHTYIYKILLSSLFHLTSYHEHFFHGRCPLERIPQTSGKCSRQSLRGQAASLSLTEKAQGSAVGTEQNLDLTPAWCSLAGRAALFAGSCQVPSHGSCSSFPQFQHQRYFCLLPLGTGLDSPLNSGKMVNAMLCVFYHEKRETVQTKLA